MRIRRRILPLALGAAALLAVPHLAAQEPPVVKEVVEIREVGVLADLDKSLRGLSASELGAKLVVLEDGVARAPMSVAALATPGRSTYSKVVVAFDAVHCDGEILAAGAAAVGSEAVRLVGLGPVDVVRAGERSETILEGSTSSETLAKVAAGLARSEKCAASPAAPVVPPGLEPGVCADKPCLLVWVGGGWGDDPAAVDAAAPALEARVAALAAGGWVVLAAPIARAEEEKGGPTIRAPEHQPGTDRYTFGVSVFGGRKREKLSPEEYNRFVDLWLTPLRRLSGATAGELATTSEELASALESLGERSILWYRAERSPGAPAPKLEVRETDSTARRLRTPEWAPSLSR